MIDEAQFLSTFFSELPEDGFAAGDNPFLAAARVVAVCQDLATAIAGKVLEPGSLAAARQDILDAIRQHRMTGALFFVPTADAAKLAWANASSEGLQHVLARAPIADDGAPPAWTAVRIAVCGVALRALAEYGGPEAQVFMRYILSPRSTHDGRRGPFGWDFYAARQVRLPAVERALAARNRARMEWA